MLNKKDFAELFFKLHDENQRVPFQSHDLYSQTCQDDFKLFANRLVRDGELTLDVAETVTLAD